MNSANLDNLVKTGLLKTENYDENEFQGYLRSGEARLKDALIENLSPESRFDLAYNAAHSLALADYEGFFEVDDQLLSELILITQKLLGLLRS